LCGRSERFREQHPYASQRRTRRFILFGVSTVRANVVLFPAAVVCLLVAPGPACFADYIIDLQAPTSPFVDSKTGHTMEQFTVTLKFNPTGADAGFKLAFFAIDVTDPPTTLATSPQLTNGGTYAAFSFTPSATFKLTSNGGNWTQPLNFGNLANPGEADFATTKSAGKLGAGTYVLGTLNLDLTVAGVTADPSLIVGLAPSDLVNDVGTVIGVVPSSTSNLLSRRAVTFLNQSQPLAAGGGGDDGGGGGPVVPAPPSLVLFVVGGAIMWVASRRYRVLPRRTA
jgi:hypothetical protein